MVEKANNTPTQLPVVSAQDETKSPLYMHGSLDALVAHVKQLLVEVPLNALEEGLLDHLLASPETSYEKITETLKKCKTRLADNKRAQKMLNRVIPLFDYHEFWSTQPVMRIYQPIEKFNTPIEQRAVSEINTNELGLPSGYNWSTIDMNDEQQALELYNLLSNHYVEDDGGNFRFDYSIDFLKWALTPPGFNPDWLIGVRGGNQQNLFGFISGIPVKMVSHGKVVEMAEINFLCVHKKLRQFRLAPVLIREVTRRVNLTNVW